ncbi:MAG: hypothetical protein JSW46_06725, partial [Gemmatimonadota bacterium]
MRRPICQLMLLLGLAGFVRAEPMSAQQILLDRPTRAGDLTLFPDLNDTTAYYYLPDQGGLAVDTTGRPRFSFLHYAVQGGGDEAVGGIVHALVSLEVTEEQLRDAERELRRSRAGARIAGPVMYKAGRFQLVSSFRNTEEGGFTRQVVGLGNAPLLERQQAAVSLHLTKLGADVLWESFRTPTPDISFSFEMDIEGFRSPKRARIEAEWDQVYSHRAFSAGVATTYFGAEIKAAFDDLRQSGAIRVTQVGADASQESLISSAYNQLTQLMFEPVNGTGSPDFASIAGAASEQGRGGPLDRATALLEQRREEATRADSSAARRRVEAADQRVQDAQSRAQNLENAATRARENATRLRQQLEAEEDSAVAERLRPLVETAERAAETYERESEAAGEDVRAAQQERDSEARSASEADLPGFAAIASFEMKRVRRRGRFEIDLNKYTSETIALRFDHNIGDLRRYMGDQSHFREVAIEPFPREIDVMVDGRSIDDFTRYINYVSVQLRRPRDASGGSVSELVINRRNFDETGNSFKLIYDSPRDAARTYEYRYVWSFFGGGGVEEAWRTGSASALSASPPYRLHRVVLDADPQALQAAQVQAVTVKLFCTVGGVERMEQLTLNV